MVNNLEYIKRWQENNKECVKEYKQNYQRKNGHISMEDRPDCPNYLGIYLAQKKIAK